MEEYRYPKADLGVEFPIKMGSGKAKAADIVVFLPGAEHKQENVFLIEEVKRADVKPTDKKDGVGQLKSYLAASANARFGSWTNGTDRLCFYKRETGEADPFQEIIDLPAKGQDLETIGNPEFSSQVPAVELRSTFRRCHDYVYANQGLPKDKAFHEFLKVIFCKVWDERNMQTKVRFFVTDRETKSQTGRQKVMVRLNDLFDEVKEQYGHIFKDAKERIELEPVVAAYIVSQFQRFSFLTSDADVKGAAYEEIVGANLRGDRGEFFTPRNVCNLAIQMVSIIMEREGKTVQKIRLIDPACGTGGFLVAYINMMRKALHGQHFARYGHTDKAADFAEQELPKVCANNVHGGDFNQLLVKAAQMNELMHGDGSGNLFWMNSLKEPNEWPSDVQAKIALGKFDLVITNPPFGTKAPIDDPDILRHYDLGHVWKKDAGAWVKVDKLRASAPPEELFLERCIKLLKPGAIAALILPDRILSNPGLTYIRHWLLQNADPIASVSLPRETFLPFTDEQTDLFIMRRRDPRNPPRTTMFAAIARNIGQDQRGNPVYLLDEDGEELVETVQRTIIRIEGGKRVTEVVPTQEPIRNDDLPTVAKRFEDWVHGGNL